MSSVTAKTRPQETSPSPQFPSNSPRTLHLVGSIPLSSNTEVFTRLSTAFPNRLLCLSDGETGKRGYFTRWQRAIFSQSPFILRSHTDGEVDKFDKTNTSEQIKLNPVEYDDFALKSYKEFKRLREQGVIEPGIRFQVCLPTPVNVISGHIKPEYQAEVEILYQDLLLGALRKIQDHIPKEDLAIQWDCAFEFAMLEGISFGSQPWFSPLKEGLAERMLRVTDEVDEGVQVGFHLCYGDSAHKHFVEPKDTGLLVEMANLISGMAKRDVNWIHMPVPKNRVDDAYYAPLEKLKLRKETMLYLGLAHAWDLDGTKRRIEAAKKVVKNFGIATECGMGRTPKDEFESVIEVLASVS